LVITFAWINTQSFLLPCIPRIKKERKKETNERTASMPLATIDTLNSDRVCEHMNEDHAACVYGMVADMYGINDKIDDVVMIRFAMDRCDFTFTLNGKALHTFRKFEPPLQTIKDARYAVPIRYTVYSIRDADTEAVNCISH
jgi:hypothetical protein